MMPSKHNEGGTYQYFPRTDMNNKTKTTQKSNINTILK